MIRDDVNGCFVCTNCGAVVEQIIDEEAEWRTFAYAAPFACPREGLGGTRLTPVPVVSFKRD